jgi:hypothetical protein
MLRPMRLAVMIAVAGCGFHAGGAHDLSSADLASAVDGGALTGPGPLGALSTGYCCTTNHDCRYRACGASGVCLDYCDSDDNCPTAYGYTCNMTNNRCAEPTQLGACFPQSEYQRGSQPIGTCCTSDGECAGGICFQYGTSNPHFCTQGCVPSEGCPGGYTCATQANGAFLDLHVCLHTGVSSYTCD